MLARILTIAAIAASLLLAACRIDAIVPVKLSDIEKAETLKQPIEVTTRLLLTFTSRNWCEDMGASLVVSLKGSGLNMAPVSCIQDQGSTDWHGELRLPIQITSSRGNAENGDLTSLVVKSGAENPKKLSVMAHLDAGRLKAAQERLLNLPAAQGNEDARIFDLSITFMIKNDLTSSATLNFDAAMAGIENALEVPAGGVRAVTVSQTGLEKLLKEQSAEIFSFGGIAQ
jgi:hypothetical protein